MLIDAQFDRLRQAIEEQDWTRTLDILDRMQGETERLRNVERFKLEAMRKPPAMPIRWPHAT